jgi:UDP-glucose 4-epimerase
MGTYGVTGAAGFVAGNLIPKLVEAGHAVRGFDVVAPDGAWRIAKEVEAKQVDYRWKSTVDLESADLDGVDALVHLAAQADVPLGIASPRFTSIANIDSTLRIWDVLSKRKLEGRPVPRVIHMSSESVYGVVPADRQPITEEVPGNPTNAYAATKLAAETIAKAYAAQFGLPLTILRSTTLYGPGSRTKQVVPIFIRQALRGQDITVEGDGSSTRDFNYVGNMVDGIGLALANPSALGTFNIGSGREVSVGELAQAAVDAVNRLRATPSKVTYGPWRAGEQGVKLRISIEKARSVLGYEPRTTFEEGLAETVRYWAAR